MEQLNKKTLKVLTVLNMITDVVIKSMVAAKMESLPNGTKMVKIVQNSDVQFPNLVVVLMEELQKSTKLVEIVQKIRVNVKLLNMVVVPMELLPKKIDMEPTVQKEMMKKIVLFPNLDVAQMVVLLKKMLMDQIAQKLFQKAVSILTLVVVQMEKLLDPILKVLTVQKENVNSLN